MVCEIHIYSTHDVTFIPFHLLYQRHLSLNAKLEYVITIY